MSPGRSGTRQFSRWARAVKAMVQQSTGMAKGFDQGDVWKWASTLSKSSTSMTPLASRSSKQVSPQMPQPTMKTRNGFGAAYTALMSKWKKIVGAVLVVLVVLALAGYMTVDTIAASLIRSEGTVLLGVDTQVKTVRLGLLEQRTTLRALTIANPEGFERPHFVQISEATIDASLGTLMSNDINIPSVHIDGLVLDLEQVNAKLNADVIVSHIKASTTSEAQQDRDPVSINIASLKITNITLHAKGSIVNLAGGTLDAEVPSFTMMNVGSKTDEGEVASQIVSLTLSILMQHIAENPVRGLSGAAVGTIATALDGIPGLRQIGISKALLDVNTGLNDTLEKAGKGVKGIGDAIGGLLGGDKKKQDEGKEAPK